MLNKEQWRVRPKFFRKLILIGVPATLALNLVGTYVYQEARLWLANGEWCVQVSPDGNKTVLYGDECHR